MLLLPENIRIRRFNLQTEAYHDFLQEEEHIMALDYDWDHNNTGFSKTRRERETQLGSDCETLVTMLTFVCFLRYGVLHGGQ